jgi:hypothetical protein
MKPQICDGGSAGLRGGSVTALFGLSHNCFELVNFSLATAAFVDMSNHFLGDRLPRPAAEIVIIVGLSLIAYRVTIKSYHD